MQYPPKPKKKGNTTSIIGKWFGYSTVMKHTLRWPVRMCTYDMQSCAGSVVARSLLPDPCKGMRKQ